MALATIPDEIHKHIEAVLVLSKRDVLVRVLHEADLCLQSEHLTTAAVLAGVALEEAALLVNPDILSEQQRQIEIWHKIYSQASRALLGQAEPDKNSVKAMITGIEVLLEQIDKPQNGLTSFQPVENTLTKIRGKYAFVQTSVDEFLKRKHDDLELENRK